MSIFLSDTEISEICDPLTQPAAQVRYLQSLGLQVQRKPNGRPLVARAEFERAMVAGGISAGPTSAPTADIIALRNHWSNRNKNGTATRER